MIKAFPVISSRLPDQTSKIHLRVIFPLYYRVSPAFMSSIVISNQL